MLIHTLTPAECEEVLARTTLGRLGCARDNQPYIVPISFYYSVLDRCLYSFATLGQKVEWMRDNPLVCLEVDEVLDRFNWSSVLVTGRYEEIVSHESMAGERQRAYKLLQERPTWWLPGSAQLDDGTEHEVSVFYRVLIRDISGRRAGGAR
jgi:nitroimidazol reductase NimA-like FMN-containing flavoprotein (pyridoxamine 5'-phosphate oxidase superfamily)